MSEILQDGFSDELVKRDVEIARLKDINAKLERIKEITSRFVKETNEIKTFHFPGQQAMQAQIAMKIFHEELEPALKDCAATATENSAGFNCHEYIKIKQSLEKAEADLIAETQLRIDLSVANSKLQFRIEKAEKVVEAANHINWLCTQAKMENLHKALKEYREEAGK